ncbi:hypothetical protein [Brevundimonas sp.]|uniref:hypothetical protein n=1 Tax=Brevundimonas sp. TaxID=1871086 RepID=UPI002FC62C2F
MSADEFDPAIERAYRVTPEFADSALFDAEVAVRLENRWKWRRAIMMVLAVGAAFVFLRQFVSVQMKNVLQGDLGDGSLATILHQSEASSVFSPLRDAAQQLGLTGISLGSISGAQILMMSGIILTLALVASAIRLANSL